MCPVYAMDASARFGPKSELFSFGVLIMEVLTGRVQARPANGAPDLVAEYMRTANGFLMPMVAPAPENVQRAQRWLQEACDARAGEWTEAVVTELAMLATSCLMIEEQRLPSMAPAMQQLLQLERTHCQLTATEEALRARVAVLQQELERLRLVETPPPQPAANEQTCLICFEDFQSTEGIMCTPAEDAAERHFMCDTCLVGYVSEAISEANFGRLTQQGGVCCPMPGCMARYGEAMLARRLPDADYANFNAAMRNVAVQARAAEIEHNFELRFQREREQILRIAAHEARAVAAREHISEQILTLRCPRAACRAAFLDFNGCCALDCHRCGAHFCAHCLEDGGADAHPHVVRCRHNPNNGNLFCSERVFQEGQRLRRIRMVQEYLATLDAATRELLLGATGGALSIMTDLQDLGITLADVEP